MRFDSIQTRLIFAALFFIVGTSLAMGFAGIRLTDRFLNARFHQNFELLAAYTARNAELGVLLGDTVMLDRLALNLLEQDDVQAVAILNSADRVLVSREKENQDFETVRIKAAIIAPQMGKENQVLFEEGPPGKAGHVLLSYSHKGLDQLKKTMTRRFILLSILLAFFPVIVYAFLARSIVSPLRDILSVSRKVSSGQTDVRAKGGKLQETRTLAAGFNEMLDVLKRQHDALEEAHEEMSRQKTLAEVGKFSMIVAHEVKNPLAIIKGSLEILKKNDLSADMKSTMLLYLEEEVARINRLMEDFLLFARPKEPQFVRTDLNRLVRDLAGRMELMDTGGNHPIRIAVADEPCMIPCDPHLMERAFSNIIRNALEAGGQEGTVEVETAIDGNFWKAQVSDTGTGIKTEHVSHIFDPFFTTKAKGTGLGLAMAKGIVEAHGGEIKADNRPGGGALFEIRLPILEVEGNRLRDLMEDRSVDG